MRDWRNTPRRLLHPSRAGPCRGNNHRWTQMDTDSEASIQHRAAGNQAHLLVGDGRGSFPSVRISVHLWFDCLVPDPAGITSSRTSIPSWRGAARRAGCVGPAQIENPECRRRGTGLRTRERLFQTSFTGRETRATPAQSKIERPVRPSPANTRRIRWRRSRCPCCRRG